MVVKRQSTPWNAPDREIGVRKLEESRVPDWQPCSRSGNFVSWGAPVWGRSLMHSNSEKWREIAKAILHENDPDSVSRLVNQLCEALDSGAAGRGPRSATEASTQSRAERCPAESSSNQMD